MLSIRSTIERTLVVSGSFLIISNLVLQVVDWVTSFIGYYRGGNEVNSGTLWLISFFGDKYIGISVEKIILIAILVFGFYAIKVLVRRREPITEFVGLVVINAVLIAFLLRYLMDMWSNLTALGF